MSRVYLFMAITAVVSALAGSTLTVAAMPAAQERVVIVTDQKAGTVRILIDGMEQVRIDETGMHVREGISYGAALKDYGPAGFDTHVGRGGGSHAE